MPLAALEVAMAAAEVLPAAHTAAGEPLEPLEPFRAPCLAYPPATPVLEGGPRGHEALGGVERPTAAAAGAAAACTQEVYEGVVRSPLSPRSSEAAGPRAPRSASISHAHSTRIHAF